MKLGRVPSPPDERDRRLATYMAPERRRETPPARNWTKLPDGGSIRFSLFANDRMGNCTCAAIGHVDEAAAAHTGVGAVIDEPEVIRAYQEIGGYPERDDGATCRDALKHFRASRKVEYYVRLDADRDELALALNLCGAVYVGADLPLAAQRQAIWDVAPNGKRDASYERRSWGGHAMAMLGYDRSGVWFVTWGRVKRATWPWVLTYCDEFWGVISDLWTVTSKLTPSGFDYERLQADVTRLAA